MNKTVDELFILGEINMLDDEDLLDEINTYQDDAVNYDLEDEE